jgi:hypothetical protein
MWRFGVSCVSAILLLSCSGDDDGPPPANDAGTDAAPTPPTCTEVPDPPEAGDPTGHAEPLAVGAGEARAGRVAAGDLPAHPDGLLTWAEGDFVLANEHIAIVIEDAGASDLYDPFGGKIVGLARMEEGRMIEPADLNEIIVGLGRFILDAETVTVVADGSDGGAAIVRARGTLRGIPFVSGPIGAVIAGSFDGLDASVDYRLEPGARHLDISSDIASPRPNVSRVQMPIVLFFQQYRMPAWAPEIGFAIETERDLPYLAFIEDGGTSYAWEDPAGPLRVFIEISGAQALLAPQFSLEPCALTHHEVARLHVGGPGLSGLNEAIAATEKTTTRTVTGVVRDASGAPAPGVRVHATTEAGAHLARVATGADGSYSLSIPSDADARIVAWRRGDSLTEPLPIPASGPLDLELAPTGEVRVTIVDRDTMEAIPARVQLVPAAPIAGPPASFGEPNVTSGRLHVEYPKSGEITLRAPPGEYRVIVSHGYEYEIVSEEVELTAGDTVEVAAVLEHVVETPNLMCGDFHIHTSRSPDSADDAIVKLLSGVADGLEIPVRTDHEWVGTFEPQIASEELTDWAFSIGSIELTTFAWGHFNVFPLASRDDMPNDGSFDWAGRLPPAVFADVRARDDGMGTPAIIINHPRSSGGGYGGYFEAADYDPITGVARAPEYWDEEFSLVEVFNDSSFDENYGDGGDSTVRDWFSFLGRGRRVYAVGSSDSHGITGSPVGYPRTCIDVGTDSSAELRTMGAGHVRDRLVGGRATVSGGIYVEANVGAVGPGGEAPGAGSTVSVHVRVQAASWVSADRLRAFVDGEMVVDVPLDESTRDPTEPEVRFDDDVTLDIPSGASPSWVVFVASGSESLEPVHPGSDPFGVTNPIFFVP